VTASIGISLYPVDGDAADVLIRHADNALYRAKETGKNTYQYFSKTLDGSATRTSLEGELRTAVEQQQLFLVYEPIVDLTTGTTVGFEALVRWNHPSAGTLRPDQFIHIAEETGLIVQLGEWVLRRSCADIERWRLQGLTDFLVSVNVAAGQFQRGNLLETVGRALRDYDVAPSRIELELTESAILGNLESDAEHRRWFEGTGVSICVDDFGTGHSSLLLLRNLAPNRLKIDRAFTMDVPDDVGTVDIVRVILVLARTLGIGVVAEGVETPAQLQCLKGLDCTRAQGYFFSRPVLPEDVPALLEEHRMLPSRLIAVTAKQVSSRIARTHAK
jgi:EAL domain-containing protein (putative c-di-GMP-specific phosphodiesterase class I)